MAEIWGAVAVVGAAVVGGVASNQASKRAAGASNAATLASLDEQGRQYDQTRSDFAHTRGLGINATNTLNRLYGYAQAPTEAQQQAQADVQIGDSMLPAGSVVKNYSNGYGEVYHGDTRIGTLTPGGASGRFLNDQGVDIAALRQTQAAATQAPAPTGPDMSAFFESPDYQFNLGEGQKAIDRSLAARGRALSGAGVREGVRYASGAASGQYSDFTNRLLAMAGLGLAATSATAGAGANAANANSQALLANGQNRANIALQNGANLNNSAQSGISNYMLNRYLGQGGGNGGYPGPYGNGN